MNNNSPITPLTERTLLKSIGSTPPNETRARLSTEFSISPKNINVNTPHPCHSKTLINPLYRMISTNWLYNITISLVTLLNLFGTNINQMVGTQDTDKYKNIVALGIIAVFIWDIFLNSKATKGYFLKVLFWIDIISTTTILLDIDWISDLFRTRVSSLTGIGYKLALIFRSQRAARICYRLDLIYWVAKLKPSKNTHSGKQIRWPSLIGKLHAIHGDNAMPEIDEGNNKSEVVITKKSKIAKEMMSKSILLLMLLIFVMYSSLLIVTSSFFVKQGNELTFSLQIMKQYAEESINYDLYNISKNTMLIAHKV